MAAGARGAKTLVLTPKSVFQRAIAQVLHDPSDHGLDRGDRSGFNGFPSAEALEIVAFSDVRERFEVLATNGLVGDLRVLANVCRSRRGVSGSANGGSPASRPSATRYV